MSDHSELRPRIDGDESMSLKNWRVMRRGGKFSRDSVPSKKAQGGHGNRRKRRYRHRDGTETNNGLQLVGRRC